MSAKPARPWFRFHLLTLALSAGAVFWINAANESKGFLRRANGHRPIVMMFQDGTEVHTANLYGWPLPFVERINSTIGAFDGTALCVDVLVGIIAIAAVAFISEKMLHRNRHQQ